MLLKVIIKEKEDKYTLNIPVKGFINIGGETFSDSEEASCFLHKLSSLLNSIKEAKSFRPIVNYTSDGDQEFYIVFLNFTYHVIFEKFSLVLEEVLYNNETILTLEEDHFPYIDKKFYKNPDWTLTDNFEDLELDDNILKLPHVFNKMRDRIKSIHLFDGSEKFYTGWTSLSRLGLNNFHKILKNCFLDQRIDEIDGDNVKINGYEFRVRDMGSGINYMWKFLPEVLLMSPYETLIDLTSTRPLHQLLKKHIYDSKIFNDLKIISIYDFDVPNKVQIVSEKA